MNRLVVGLIGAFALLGCVELDDPDVEATPVLKATSSVTYYVSNTGGKAANGTASRPFPTITRALAAASKLNATSTTIYIADGVYPENLSITRTTSLIGASRLGTRLVGSVSNWQATTSLSIRTLRVEPPSGYAGIGSMGPTSLLGVSVVNASSYGVLQIGTQLTADGLQVTGTRATASPAGINGAALHIVGGARADLSGFYAGDNHQGIVAADAGTVVSLTSLGIENTLGVSLPGSHPRSAAINVMGGAHLQVNGGSITNTTGLGINLTASSARLTYLDVSGITTGAPVWGPDNNHSYALYAGTGSRLEAITTRFVAPGTYGVVLDSTSLATLRSDIEPCNQSQYDTSDGYAFCVEQFNLHHASWVEGFAVGISVLNQAQKLSCLAAGTNYDNGANIVTETLPLPPAPDLDGTGEHTEAWLAGCTSVPLR